MAALTLTKSDVTNYIESKKNAWAVTTIKSEHARLRNVLELVNQGPEALFVEGSKKWAPYTLKTLFIRVGELVEFVTKDTKNAFKEYMATNANQFKNAYVKKEVGVSFDEARARTAQIKDVGARQLAQAILSSGMRASEALSYDGSGIIVGKGARLRPLINSNVKVPVKHNVTYSKLHKALQAVGLKPHTLRKLTTTQLVEAGFKEADLMKVMGWSNIQTASIYMQPKHEEELKRKMEEALK